MRHLLLLTVLTLPLAGCSAAWMGEDRAYAMQKDWSRLGTTDWEEASRIDEVFPSPQAKERKNEQKICMHANATNRVTTQDGVNDSVASRHCPLAPYNNNAGTRLGIRPDGQGTVLK